MNHLQNYLRIIPGIIFPVYVVDLYIASYYSGPRDKIYTRDQIFNRTDAELQAFGNVFNLETSNKERILRILNYLDLIYKGQDQSIPRNQCWDVSTDFLPEGYIDCIVKVNDSDSKINALRGWNEDSYHLHYNIQEYGSIGAYSGAKNSNQAAIDTERERKFIVLRDIDWSNFKLPTPITEFIQRYDPDFN